LAITCGADFVKTSTGKMPAGASLEAVAAMLEAISSADRPIGLKPSGGIRTFEEAMQYIELADSVMGQGGRPRRRSGSAPAGCSTRCSRSSRVGPTSPVRRRTDLGSTVA
jgi:deoxyribose-phosphate aldolase